MAKPEKKNFDQPDETYTYPKLTLQRVKLGEYFVRKLNFEPGWKWSEHYKPTAQTEWCEYPHVVYQVSGRMHLLMKDGTELDVGPGDALVVPPDHDCWVVGDEPAVALDFVGLLESQHG